MRSRRLAAEARLKAAAVAKERGPRPQPEKDALRQRFVAQVKSYVGTPYNAKHNGEQLAEGALTLDCCGLVRKALLDLKDEFGFEVGPWAQEYLFDTLPKEVAPSELEIGDLIFWTGEPDDPERKRHKHDMVHVEVFVGEGGGSYPIEGGATSERTCGSRYEGEGVAVPGVALFKSYRSFGGHGHHGHRLLFRSIDTWLDGICINHCKECSWAEPPPSGFGAKRGGANKAGGAMSVCKAIAGNGAETNAENAENEGEQQQQLVQGVQ